MKFRRKSEPEVPAEETPDAAAEQAPSPREGWPQDSADVPEDEELVDLGSLRLRQIPEREVRLQVDEQSGTVQAVLIVGPDGAVEVRAFAAPRNGDLWDDVRPQLAAETQRAGGQAAEREGRFGTELLCRRPATTPEGEEAVAPTRVVGINGDRWLLRATFLGRPAVEEDTSEWDDTLAAVVVHRGTEAMPVGEALPLHLPPQARRAE
ncbi:DUF3710 domain-containing protein [Nocardioides rotundus]|uniref:DUF3710 domain-containing protein n=1 Tax=Nocardioides rotundus TaxID=1774216 RepID=UPI001CBAE537|nr:DUF3710 domain-containing protein [Nocardioides rotundus]UAL28280.1 DUF3710 domain-containing protein [Nocardioides rotundus]